MKTFINNGDHYFGMMLKETLRSVAKSQAAELPLLDNGVERDGLRELDVRPQFALILSGIRRCGKSTLLRQLMEMRGKTYYFNFEDPRVEGFEPSDFSRLDEVFHEENGDSDCYFFDEIQNAPRWETFIRPMLDRGKMVVITGSNASLLSRELGTRLTGRHIRHEVFPFSFGEFTRLAGVKPGPKAFTEYMKRGGFPGYIKSGNDEVLRELFNDILARDIAMRHGLRSFKALKEMALFLMSNIGKEFTYNSLKKAFGLGSVNSAISFVSYLEDSYLLFSVPRFDYSPKKQLVSPKKIYSIDNGLSRAVSLSFSDDAGRALENAVHLELRRRRKEIFYFKGRGECDFLVKEGMEITEAIQVCHSLNEENKARELGGLIEAMEKFKLNEGLILTYADEDEVTGGGRKIKVLPAFKWMLGRSAR